MVPIADLQKGSQLQMSYMVGKIMKISDEYIMIPDRLIPQNINSVEGVCIVILKGGWLTPGIQERESSLFVFA